MNNVCFSNCKDEKIRSEKECVCGGHNSKNYKKNLNHHATKQKIKIREMRKFRNQFKEMFLNEERD